MDKNSHTTPRILIVEDHPYLRETLVSWMTELFPSIPINQATTGEESVSQAGKLRPEIILMDIGLPGIDGIEATREIFRRGIPAKIVILTNLDGDIYKKNALEAGAVEFIPKWKMKANLSETVEKLIHEYRDKHSQQRM